jgi:hypothetical protein
MASVDADADPKAADGIGVRFEPLPALGSFEPGSTDCDAVLALQRRIGNRATAAAVGRGPFSGGADRRLARCLGPCTCGGTCGSGSLDDEVIESLTMRLQRAVAERPARDPTGSRVVLAEMPFQSAMDPFSSPNTRATTARLQRDETPNGDATTVATTSSQDPSAAPPPADESRTTDQSYLGPAVDVTDAQARSIVADYIAKLGPLGATTIPFASDLVASADLSSADEVSVQAWPAARMLMRSPGAFKLEAGFVGALQLCYDLCTGDLSVNGWVWAGGGVASKGLLGGESWWGAYVFAEKEFGKWHLDFMPRLSCGTCDPACKVDGDGTEFAAGIAGFPVVLKPGERKSLKQAGIEVGALLTPHIGHCSADLELVVLIDLTKYLGPVGAAVKSAQDLLNKWAKEAGEEFDCGVGVVVSGTLHLCKSAPGGGIAGITSDSALLCGGGFVGCALGLSHERASLPGGGH